MSVASRGSGNDDDDLSEGVVSIQSNKISVQNKTQNTLTTLTDGIILTATDENKVIVNKTSNNRKNNQKKIPSRSKAKVEINMRQSIPPAVRFKLDVSNHLMSLDPQALEPLHPPKTTVSKLSVFSYLPPTATQQQQHLQQQQQQLLASGNYNRPSSGGGTLIGVSDGQLKKKPARGGSSHLASSKSSPLLSTHQQQQPQQQQQQHIESNVIIQALSVTTAPTEEPYNTEASTKHASFEGTLDDSSDIIQSAFSSRGNYKSSSSLIQGGTHEDQAFSETGGVGGLGLNATSIDVKNALLQQKLLFGERISLEELRSVVQQWNADGWAAGNPPCLSKIGKDLSIHYAVMTKSSASSRMSKKAEDDSETVS